MSVQSLVTVGLSMLLLCTSFIVNASDATTEKNESVIGLATLSPEFPMMDILAEETIRRIEARGIQAEHIMRDATAEQTRSSAEPQLLLAGLDTFIARWTDESAEDEGALLDTLLPVEELVRDHQAFLMLQTPNAQELRSRFARAHGAAGPMSIGGLRPEGHMDHLVAMMLMDAVGQDSTQYPYRQYESLDSLAIGLLTGEVKLLSIPVSQALQMPLEGGIKIIATSSANRQDVMTQVPTLTSARIDLHFTNYIGLYRQSADESDELQQTLSSLVDLSSDNDWPEQVYELGLVDDYTNEGKFSINVLRELSRLKRFSEMLEQ